MNQPLNPLLFRRLEETFGKVQISDPGIAATFLYRPDWQYRQGRLKAEIVEYGETYKVSCPFCSDTRGRLWICHHWAVRDQRTNDDMLHLATCFNEQCLSTREAQKELHALIFPNGVYGREMKVQLPAVPSLPAPPAPRRFVLPEGQPLCELPENHPAIRYLRRRKFNPEQLAKRWGLCYCESNPKPSAEEHTRQPYFYEGRILFPIFAPSALLDEKTKTGNKVRLAGWQARALKAHLGKGIQKYLNATGMKRNELLYGLTRAIETEGPIVIVEGVTDVWRLKTNSVALFGKTISQAQCKLILRHFSGRPIVVLLDQDAATNAHEVCQRIRSSRSAIGEDTPVVVAKLPPNRKDPGECTYQEAWKAVNAVLEKTTTG